MKNSGNGRLCTVRICQDMTKQTMVDIGGNFCNASYRPSAVDAVGDFTLENLKPRYVRVPIPVKHWEPEDKGEKDSADPERFRDADVINSLFLLLKDMKENRGVVNFTASVWDVPDWMVTNPENRSQRIIPPSMYERVARSVAAFMARARDVYGVDIDYFSFNESDGGYQTLFTSEEYINFIKTAVPVFSEYGLKTKFLVGDSYATHSLVSFASPILEEESIRDYLGPVTYHSWWSEDKPDSVFSDVAALAARYGKPVWCNELGYDAMLYRNRGEGINPYETWDNAWRLARITYRVLKYSDAVVTQYWTYQNNFPLVSRDLRPYPAYYVMKQLVESLPGGSQLVEARSGDKNVWALAAERPDGTIMVQLMNNNEEEIKIRLEGADRPGFRVIRTSEKENMRELGSIPAEEGVVTAALPPQSITTFISED